MPTTSEWNDVDLAAKELIGNWKTFDCFAWHGSPDDADERCIIYTENRDSGSLEKSNSAAIAEELKPFLENGDIVSESHNHWACGWVDGYSILVYRDGKPTEAFRKYCELRARLDDYPVLDEEDFSERELEESLEIIKEIGRGHIIEGVDDDYWTDKVYRKLNFSSPESIRSKEVYEAIVELGFCAQDELPITKFPSHVIRTVMSRLDGLDSEGCKNVLKEVIQAMFDSNGRPHSQVEEIEMILSENNLWAQT
jgi:hypothetical protein